MRRSRLGCFFGSLQVTIKHPFKPFQNVFSWHLHEETTKKMRFSTQKRPPPEDLFDSQPTPHPFWAWKTPQGDLGDDCAQQLGILFPIRQGGASLWKGGGSSCSPPPPPAATICSCKTFHKKQACRNNGVSFPNWYSFYAIIWVGSS